MIKRSIVLFFIFSTVFNVIVYAFFTASENNSEGIIPVSSNVFSSNWDVSTLTSETPPQIGDIYVQERYDPESQSIIQDTWEYIPGIAMYDLPQNVNLNLLSIPTLSYAGWVLKQHKVTKIGTESKTYLFKYEYLKDKKNNWSLRLNIEEGETGDIIKNINLVQHNVDIAAIKDVDSLINMLTYQPREDKRNQIIAQIKRVNQWKVYFARNIATLLYSDKDFERMKAVQQVGEEKEPSAVDALCLALLNDSNVNVRFNAAWGLGVLKNPGAGDALKKAALNEKESTDPVSNVRAEAVWALGEIGDAAALDTLDKILFYDEAHPTLRGYAVTSLVKIEGLNAVPKLERALFQEKDSGVRAVILDELSNIGNLKAMEILINFLKDKTIEKNKYEIDTIENKLATKGKGYLELLLNAYRNPDIKENIEEVFRKTGSGAIKPLIELIKNNSSYSEEAKDVLVLIGNASFIPVVKNLLSSNNSDFQKYAVEIIKGIAEEKGEQETGIDPDIDIIGLDSMSKEYLEKIASNNKYSITRALALYYLGKNYQDEGFLRDYIFNGNDGKLSVKNENITKLEMAAILNTGIPADAKWWEKLTDKDEEIKYLKLLLKGDFTDEKAYIPEREWVCVQYATQLFINSRGFANLKAENQIADKEAFQNWGTGYFIQDLENGYGIPLFYVEDGIHAYDAVFLGDTLFDKEGKISPGAYGINNWILVEPQNDSFTPKHLGRRVNVYLNIQLLLPDAECEGLYYKLDSEGNTVKIVVDTEDYSYR